MKSRLVSLYLPQYHPIPQNDDCWGKGFTEWTNVSKARPFFPGHYQPHIPADLGFYDLRLPETRQAQADLARAYGIEGFCYYHYWFNGQRLLERPFNEVLTSGKPDFPFCLAWANETWSKRWLGEEKEVIMKQTYSAEDDINHARWLLKVFADKRCIRIQGRPLFLIYRPFDLPEPQRTLETIRKECSKAGLPNPYLVGINSHTMNQDMRKAGFDGTMNFEPQLGVLPDFLVDPPKFSRLLRNSKLGIFSAKYKVYDYSAARELMTKHKAKFPAFPCVFVGWDNTPRRGGNGIIVVNSSPEKFAAALKQTTDSVLDKPYDDRVIFLNAWNEWAEGNHLEPDLKYGLKYLEAVRSINMSGNHK